MSQLGVPYPPMTSVEIKENAINQGIEIVKRLQAEGLNTEPDRKIVALIAYLQKLGKFDPVEIEDTLLTTPEAVPFPLKPGNPDVFRDGKPSTAQVR